jgi:GMP synthase-like glutamine amidotransferase
MKILIVDNNLMRDSWGADDLARVFRRVSGAETRVRRAPHNDLNIDPTRFDRIILSGSLTGAADQAPWIEQLDLLIQKTVDRGVPLLGVCYGHQSLVRALHSRENVRRARLTEYGWTKIWMTV